MHISRRLCSCTFPGGDGATVALANAVTTKRDSSPRDDPKGIPGNETLKNEPTWLQTGFLSPDKPSVRSARVLANGLFLAEDSLSAFPGTTRDWLGTRFRLGKLSLYSRPSVTTRTSAACLLLSWSRLG